MIASVIDQATIINNFIVVNNFSVAHDFDCVCLTGGEPMLYPEKLKLAIKKIRQINPKCLVYFYTAKFDTVEAVDTLASFFDQVDGIQFSLHQEATEQDISGFERLQGKLLAYKQYGSGYNQKSFRAYIDPRIFGNIFVTPQVWSRLEIKPWIKEEDCCLPSNETLFVLKEE
jgi:hypothetical protein